MSDLPTELVPLNAEQRDIVELTRTFAREEIRPRARAVDEADNLLCSNGFFADPLMELGSSAQIVDESHPVSLGVSLHSPSVQKALADCDAVLAVGTELAESDLWSPPPTLGGTLIRVDLDPAQMYAGSLPADIALIGDARATLGALCEALAELHPTAASGDGAARSRSRSRPNATVRCWGRTAPAAPMALVGRSRQGTAGRAGPTGRPGAAARAGLAGPPGAAAQAGADGTARGRSTATASSRGLTAAARTEKSADHGPSSRHPTAPGPDSALPAGDAARTDGTAGAGDSGVTAAARTEESADHDPPGRHPARPGPDSALSADGTARVSSAAGAGDDGVTAATRVEEWGGRDASERQPTAPGPDSGLTAASRAEESAGRCAALAVRAVVPPLRTRDAYTSGSAAYGPAARAVSALRRERDAETAVRDSRWVPYLRAIRGVLDEDAVITSDSAQCCCYGALPHLPVGPRGRYLHPTGFGTLGYALPAAIGAKSAYPERQVVALSGDGGLQFTVQELATAAQLGLPLPVVVFDNGGYGEIRDEMNARGDTPTAVDLPRVDLPVLCRAYGGRGAHAASPGALADALARALNTPGPTLITVPEETTA